MVCSSMRQILDLMTTGCAGRGHDRFGRFLQRRQKSEVGDWHTQTVMLALEAERAGHAAATAVQHCHVEFRHESQRCCRAAGAEQRFLMTMAVKQALLRKRPQG